MEPRSKWNPESCMRDIRNIYCMYPFDGATINLEPRSLHMRHDSMCCCMYLEGGQKPTGTPVSVCLTGFCALYM